MNELQSPSRWHGLAVQAIAHQPLSREDALSVLAAPDEEILALLDAAYAVRRAEFGKRVQIHVLENAKLGDCPEDCGFCSQSSKHDSPSGEAPIKTVEELVAGAHRAVAAKARRYCMVTATRGPSSRDLEVICDAARRIKQELDIELCASLGFLNEDKAGRLVDAGIDRFNHNLETSERHFAKVVSTHKWSDRVDTIRSARAAGMETCCGGIVGLGEDDADIVELAFALRELEVDSVPVNFLDPRPGTPMSMNKRPGPYFALKVLCMFRFVHPRADLRVGGGREVTLRSLVPLSLYAANSIFTSGYLTTDGATPTADFEMIRDLGFELELTDGVGEQPPAKDTLGAVDRHAKPGSVRLPVAS